VVSAGDRRHSAYEMIIGRENDFAADEACAVEE